MRFPDCGRKDLKYPEWTPVLKNELSGNVGMLELMRYDQREKDGNPKCLNQKR